MAEEQKLPLKIIAGADSFGCTLKESLVTHLRSPNMEVEDMGTDDYYTMGALIGHRVSSEPTITRGLAVCGTGVGVQIFANKFPGVYAATCLSPSDALNARSINNSNVLALSGSATSPTTAIEILTTFLNTPFKSPCPASSFTPWDPNIESFLDKSLSEMSKIGSKSYDSESGSCPMCDVAEGREFSAMSIIPGGYMKIVRESPTSAIVRFDAGSVEPAHHHTFGHDLVVLKGKKTVWNLSKGDKCDLGVGDYLFTPAGDVHRVKYWEDSEFFIKWDGAWDILMDEDLDAAQVALDEKK